MGAGAVLGSSPKLERRLNSSRLRLKKPGTRQAEVGRMVAGEWQLNSTWMKVMHRCDTMQL